MNNPTEGLQRLLANPSIDSWHEIVKMGKALHRDETASGFKLWGKHFIMQVRRGVAQWPLELDRTVPATWPEEWRKGVEYRIRETQTYGIYEANVCGDQRLRLSDGSQAVRLRRRYSGAALSITGSQVMTLGIDGEADLSGGMTIEWLQPRRTIIEAYVALEVKTATGTLKPNQEAYLNAVIRRGGVAGVVTSVNEAVLFLIDQREKIKARFTPRG